MQTFDAWDIIKVPFPNTDRPVRERRPALVMASGSTQERHGLLWVMMITSSENRS
jgi:mRNA interferase MazF